MKKDLKYFLLNVILLYLVIPVFLMNLWILLSVDNLSWYAIGFFIISFATSGFTIVYLVRDVGKLIIKNRKKKVKKE